MRGERASRESVDRPSLGGDDPKPGPARSHRRSHRPLARDTRVMDHLADVHPVDWWPRPATRSGPKSRIRFSSGDRVGGALIQSPSSHLCGTTVTNFSAAAADPPLALSRARLSTATCTDQHVEGIDAGVAKLLRLIDDAYAIRTAPAACCASVGGWAAPLPPAITIPIPGMAPFARICGVRSSTRTWAPSSLPHADSRY